MRTAIYRVNFGPAWNGGPVVWSTAWRVGNRLCETMCSDAGYTSAVIFTDLYPEDQSKSLDQVLAEIYDLDKTGPLVRLA